MLDKSIHISKMAPIIEELVNAGKEIEISPQGVSMQPSIVDGDIVTLIKPKFPLKKYDVAFYRRGDGSVVLHRVVGMKKGAYIMVGDSQNYTEYPVHERDIIAVAAKVVREGEVIEEIGKGKSKYTARHHRYLLYLRIRGRLGAIYRKIFRK